jgi:hypothetical protein
MWLTSVRVGSDKIYHRCRASGGPSWRCNKSPSSTDTCRCIHSNSINFHSDVIDIACCAVGSSGLSPTQSVWTALTQSSDCLTHRRAGWKEGELWTIITRETAVWTTSTCHSSRNCAPTRWRCTCSETSSWWNSCAFKWAIRDQRTRERIAFVYSESVTSRRRQSSDCAWCWSPGSLRIWTCCNNCLRIHSRGWFYYPTGERSPIYLQMHQFRNTTTINNEKLTKFTKQPCPVEIEFV